MAQLLQLFILIPLAAFLVSLFLPRKKEPLISGLTIAAAGLHLLLCAGFCIYWLVNRHPTLDIKHIVLFKTEGFEFFIDFYFDKITAAYALVGSVLTFLVAVFSKYYLHREEGFKRFFSTLLFFCVGYNLVIFSGNFETLFLGWEILGITSFLLVAFYRDRYLPVKNSLKTIFIYRVGDICLILAMWMAHHLWHTNITFAQLNTMDMTELVAQHPGAVLFIALMIFVAAAAKSGQLPFSSWLPRAMEGPTTSSAIFYGALAVHAGVFLLMRTYPLWQHVPAMTILVIVTGALTCIVATSIARVQPSVKTQIAYWSIAQIGIIFVEVALGFHIVALIHFAANAFLRTYQLLVSPSIMSYSIHDMFFSFIPGQKKNSTGFFARARNSVYLLGVKEWNLDFLLYRGLWDPFKWTGKKLGFVTGKGAAASLAVVHVTGLFVLSSPEIVPGGLFDALPLVFSAIGFVLIVKAFAERGDARKAWILTFCSHLFIGLAIALNSNVELGHMLLYLGGTIVAAVVGYLALTRIYGIDQDIQLDKFHGYVYEQQGMGFLFLLACLALLGFPLTPTFIGIDLMFTHIGEGQIALIILTALSFLFIELSILRIYTRVFLGQHKKAYHAIAFKAS